MVHKLKTWPEYYIKIKTGQKKFEIRLNDRDFKEGDLIELHEYVPKEECYTGDFIRAEIGFLMDGQYIGITNGFVVFSLVNIEMNLDIFPDQVQFL